MNARPSQALTFFFPYREVSGVPMLFSRMASYLAARGIDVRVIDYPDGAMASRIRDVSGIRLIPFSDGVPLPVGDDAVLVMQSILPATIRPELRIAPTTPLFFWTLHPANLIQTIVPLPFFRDLQMRSALFHDLVMRTMMRPFAADLREFVNAIAASGALAFMDGETLRMTRQRTGADIQAPVFLPVPSDRVTGNRYSGRSDVAAGGLSFGWLGRLADFKIHILLHTLERASRLARERRMETTFHVIGEGPDAHRIRPEQLEHEHFKLIMAGRITGNDLDDYLSKRLDILAAMGTSALEGARLGVPTVLLDIAYGRVPKNYRFRWLHEATGYTLGEIIGPQHTATGGEHSLEEIVDALLKNRGALSWSAFGYYRTHHAIDVVAARFLDAAQHSSFRYGDINRRLLRKSGFRRLYERVRSARRQAALANPKVEIV